MRVQRGQRNGVVIEVAHPRGQRLVTLVRSRALKFMRALKLQNRELSVLLVTDRAIRRLNRTWRRKDKATDVLSFPAGDVPPEFPGKAPLGDIVISLDTSVRAAKELSVTLEAEVSRYLAHGLLHLLGHDHLVPKDAKKMRALEQKLLGREGLIGEGVFGE